MSDQIRQQVEFYFSDQNLPGDKYLQSLLQKNGGWVPINELLKFNRVKKICSNANQIVNALQNSTLVDISSNGQSVRRKPELKFPDMNSF